MKTNILHDSAHVLQNDINRVDLQFVCNDCVLCFAACGVNILFEEVIIRKRDKKNEQIPSCLCVSVFASQLDV